MKKRYCICGILLFLFLFIMFLVLTNSIVEFDDFIYHFIYSFRNSFFDSFFRIITMFCNTVPVICFVIFLIFFLKKEDKILLCSSIGVTVLVNQIIKHIVQRIRPDHYRLIEQNGYSFPSGHAMVSVALYGVLIYLIFTKVNNRNRKILYISLLSLLIVLVGISRIYLGVHYPSDVLAGYCLSFCILISIISVFSRFGGILYDKDDCK